MPYYSTLRRPLVGIALTAVSGMVIAATGLFSIGMLLFAALGCILLAGLLLRTRASVLLVFSSVALVSACRFMVSALPLSGEEINRLQPQLPMENVQLIGRVLDPPEYHAYRSGDLGVWVFPLECEGLKTAADLLVARRLSGSSLIVDRGNTPESDGMHSISQSPVGTNAVPPASCGLRSRQDGGGKGVSTGDWERTATNLRLLPDHEEAPLASGPNLGEIHNTPEPNGRCSNPPSTINPSTNNLSGVSPSTINPSTINQSGVPPSTINPSTINQSGVSPSTINPSTNNLSGFPPSTINPSTINQPGTAWLTHRGRIQVRVTGAPPGDTYRQGGRFRFSGTLLKRGFPGGDPIELVAPASGGWEILSGPPRFSPLIWGQRLREGAARSLSNGIENHMGQLAVYKALLLGYRKAIPPEIHQQFKRTGTLHIFAISGLHVGIAGLLITVVLKTLGLPRDRWGLLLLPLLLGYVVATGMKSSALRALAMAAVYFLSPIFRRKPDVPVSIAFSAMLLLFFNPLEILSAGFIFSFTVVSFIVMLFATVPKEFIFRGAGWVRTVRAYVTSLGVTSIAASIASIPLTALFFGSFATVSLVGNLVVVPLTFCIVLSGWLSILVPATSGIFNYAALVFINGLLGTVGYLSSPPGAFLHVQPPPLTALLFWYSGWIHLFTHARTTRQRTASFVLIGLSIALTFLSAK